MFIQAGVLCKWTTDSQRFLLEYLDTINNSPSHIYHSALPLCPSSSWFSKFCNEDLSLQVKVVQGLPAEWGLCSRTVSLDAIPYTLSYCKNTIAVGLRQGDIIIFNSITGSQTAIFSGHTDEVSSLVFSSDGTSLVSGGHDGTVKLWDVQTGGVIRTFSGHSSWVYSVSISADSTMIGSGSDKKTIHLWDIQTGECHHIIKQQASVVYVCFSPTDPQYLLSQSGGKIWQWDTNINQITPICDGSGVAFSPDGTQFVLSNEEVVTVQNSNSRAIVAEFHVASVNANCCCFSSDGRLVAVASGHTAYIWNITGSSPHLIETLIGHTYHITSIVFSSPSSLISVSIDQSVKFWQIGVPSTDPVETDSMSTPITSAPIESITLQAKDGVAISSDSDGVVRIWDTLTGICKTSFQTPAKGSCCRDIRLIDGRLILVWHADKKIHIWDLEGGEVLKIVGAPTYELDDLRITGDGSKIFSMLLGSIQVWSRLTGGRLDRIDTGWLSSRKPLTVDGSRVWIYDSHFGYHGWDFGTKGSPPVQLSNTPPDNFHLTGTMWWDNSWYRIKDTVTGKVIFELSGRFANPTVVQCDGFYLAAGYHTGEVLILDLNYLSL